MTESRWKVADRGSMEGLGVYAGVLICAHSLFHDTVSVQMGDVMFLREY